MYNWSKVSEYIDRKFLIIALTLDKPISLNARNCKDNFKDNLIALMHLQHDSAQAHWNCSNQTAFNNSLKNHAPFNQCSSIIFKGTCNSLTTSSAIVGDITPILCIMTCIDYLDWTVAWRRLIGNQKLLEMRTTLYCYCSQKRIIFRR